jgi:hypothetical protein
MMALEKEAWSLISHCIRVIFKLLRNLRSSGARSTVGTRDAQMVWAQFQCHRLMEELWLAQFNAHPALSYVLNLHLQDNVVSRSRYESLERKVTEIAKIANEAKKKELTSILHCRFVHHALLRTVDPRAWHTRVCGAM